MALRPAYLAGKLPAKLVVLDGTVISTIEDASNFLLNLPEDRAKRGYWKRAFELILEEATGGAIERQMRLALLLDGKLDMKRTPV